MKAIKITLLLAAIAFTCYHAVYFKKLDAVKVAQQAGVFDAKKYAKHFWDTQLMQAADSAIDLATLTGMLQKDPAAAFDKYSHALGIGNLRYFLVKGNAMVDAVTDEKLELRLLGDSGHSKPFIATEYIFGNAVRDASGLINVSEFVNTMDFNNVSNEINRLVRAEALPSLRAKAKPGSVIRFAGAIELNKEHLDISGIEIIPIRTTIK